MKNAADQAVEMNVNVRLSAAGAGMPSGLALSLPVASTTIASVTGQRLTPALFSTGLNGVEADGSNSIIPIFANSHAEFGVEGNPNVLVNTDRQNGIAKNPIEYTLKITFNPGVPAASLTTTPDLFIVVNNTRGKEIHVIGKRPSSKADMSLFNTLDDASNATLNNFYKSKAGAPWALIIPAQLPWAVERADISLPYLKFANWVKSGGASYADWYLDKAGYRDAAELY